MECEPDAKNPVLVDGKPQDTGGQKPVQVLAFLLDNNGQTKKRNDIIAKVWGEENASQTSNEALSSAVARANKALAGTCKIENIRNQGYRIDVELTKIEPAKTQTIVIHEKLTINKSTLMLYIFSLVFLCLGFLATTSQPHPTASYTVTNIEQVVTWNNAVTRPLISPDGKLIAYRLISNIHQDVDLVVSERATAAMTKMAKIRYDDGFRWHIAGDKILYQTKVDNRCEIRLAYLTVNKSIKQDELLTTCRLNSGRLSFAWFNQDEFYFNGVDNEAPGLPFHQLYRFNINTKAMTKVLTTELEGGIGFYSLEYDLANDTLYMLKLNREYTSDVYRYKNGKLDKIANIGHLLRYYTVFNGQFIYVNDRNELVASDLASNLSVTKVLLPSIKIPISMPNIVNNQIAFMSGHLFSYALHMLDNGTIESIELAGLIPYNIAEHPHALLFTSKQTGINQIYQRLGNGEVKQLSNFSKHSAIQHLSAIDDIVAVSYINRVDLYRLKQSKLTFISSLSHFTDGILAKNGKTILLTKVTNNKNQLTDRIVELQLADFEPTGLPLDQALMAIYHQDSVIYINRQQQLMRLHNGEHQLLFDNIAVNSISAVAHNDAKFYYVAKDTKQLMVFDFTTNTLEALDLKELIPSHITTINGELYIRTQKSLPPKLLVGSLSKN